MTCAVDAARAERRRDAQHATSCACVDVREHAEQVRVLAQPVEADDGPRRRARVHDARHDRGNSRAEPPRHQEPHDRAARGTA